MPIHIDGYQP